MNSTSSPQVAPKALQGLIRVRRMRLDAAASLVRQHQLALRAATRELQAAQAHHQEAERSLRAFREFTAGDGAAQVAGMSVAFGHYRDRLADAVVRAGNEITRHRNLVAAAQALLERSRKAWLAQQVQHDAVIEVQRLDRRARALAVQRLAEEEAGEMRSGGALHMTVNRAACAPRGCT